MVIKVTIVFLSCSHKLCTSVCLHFVFDCKYCRKLLCSFTVTQILNRLHHGQERTLYFLFLLYRKYMSEAKHKSAPTRMVGHDLFVLPSPEQSLLTSADIFAFSLQENREKCFQL